MTKPLTPGYSQSLALTVKAFDAGGIDRQPINDQLSLPPLTMLRAFEAVGRLASMRKAAKSLNVGHSAISRHLANLEAWFRTRLVVTGPQGVELTADGKHLFQAAHLAFSVLAEATSEIRPNSGHRKQLNLWCAPGFANHWLVPRLNKLQNALSDTDISIRATPELPDFEIEGADAAIIFRDNAPADLDAILIERPRVFPVASPSWIAAHSEVKTFSDLNGHLLVHGDNIFDWRRFFKSVGVEVGAAAMPRLWSASSVHEATIAGLGVALCSGRQVADDIALGRLVELFDTRIYQSSYWLVFPKNGKKPRTVSSLGDWLKKAIYEN